MVIARRRRLGRRRTSAGARRRRRVSIRVRAVRDERTSIVKKGPIERFRFAQLGGLSSFHPRTVARIVKRRWQPLRRFSNRADPLPSIQPTREFFGNSRTLEGDVQGKPSNLLGSRLTPSSGIRALARLFWRGETVVPRPLEHRIWKRISIRI